MLAATAQVPRTYLARFALAGELSLRGELMPTPGILSVAIAAARASLERLSREEALEATQLHSVAGLLAGRGVLRSRPFRAPHHSVLIAGLLGGGAGHLRPGEVSLAHHGVSCLDAVQLAGPRCAKLAT